VWSFEVIHHLRNDCPSFHPVHSLIRAIGPRFLHHAQGRGPCLHPWSAASLDSDSRNIFQESLSRYGIPESDLPELKELLELGLLKRRNDVEYRLIISEDGKGFLNWLKLRQLEDNPSRETDA
jgi:hypothetical protein